MKEKNRTKKGKLKMWIIAALIIVPIIVSMCIKTPEGTNFAGGHYKVSDFGFIYDLSYEVDGETTRELNILDENIRVINEAEEYVIADLFLFNDEYNREKGVYPKSVEKVCKALIEKKTANPDMPVYLITDPINNFYGAYEQEYITMLKNGGVEVVITELDKRAFSREFQARAQDLCCCLCRQGGLRMRRCARLSPCFRAFRICRVAYKNRSRRG